MVDIANYITKLQRPWTSQKRLAECLFAFFSLKSRGVVPKRRTWRDRPASQGALHCGSETHIWNSPQNSAHRVVKGNIKHPHHIFCEV